MQIRPLLALCLFVPLAGCAASWQSIDVYAPHDPAELAEARLSVVRPVVTSRPDAEGTPWGGQSARLFEALQSDLDGAFVSITGVEPQQLGWSDDSWSRVDGVISGLLNHAPNPFPRGEHWIEEGEPADTGAAVGGDGLVLLVALQPSMRETLARLSGVSGEVTQNSGFVDHLGQAGQYDQFGSRSGQDAPPPRNEVTDLSPEVGTMASPAEPPDGTTRRERRERERNTLLGKQNRVDVALLLVDVRSGRFVAASSVRLEPIQGPQGSYRGAIERALRDWRLREAPWTTELTGQ